MSRRLAIDGGRPIRKTLLPYGRHWIAEDDIAAVASVLRSDWLTTGPAVAEFERVFATATGAASAVAVSSGTAALHAAMFALGVGEGDEVIVPAMTFAATANCVLYQGATPVFADVDDGTLLLGAVDAERRVTKRTKALVAVDYAGQPCDYDALADLAKRKQLALVADACHALGAMYRGRRVGSLAQLSTFSFHPVKHIAAGEGGAVTTAEEPLARRLRLFRNHGITTDSREREQTGSWQYEMVELGYNYRLTDLQCALAQSQLKKLPAFLASRREIARRYTAALADIPAVAPLVVRTDAQHAYHLFVVRLRLDQLRATRAQVFAALCAEGIGVNVHYVPVHLHPFYRKRLGTGPGLCPVAEAAYEEILSLPMFPAMSDADVDDVIAALVKVTGAYSR